MTRKMRVSSIIATVAIASVAAICYTLHRSDRRAGIAEVRCRDKVTNFERSDGDCVNNAHLTPIGAFDFQGVAMATKTCQHMIVTCAKFHCMCNHAEFDGACDKANCENEKLPTFRQMGEIYLNLKQNIAYSSKRTVLPSLEKISKTIGLDLDSKVALGINEWADVYKQLKAKYDPATIKQLFSVFTRCAGVGDKTVRLEYVRRGITRPNCDFIPDVDFSTKNRKIEELSGAQIDIVMDEMMRLRNSSRNADRRRFVWLWFALYFGVRPADICRLKWDCIKTDPNGGKRFEYVPGKTMEKTNGRAAAGRIHPKLLRWIEPYIGSSDEYVIGRKTQHTGKETRRHGAYEGMHNSIHSWVNRFMRDRVGVKGHMAGYLLRRDCSKWMLEHKGSLAETVLLGHTERVRDTNYVNRESINVTRIAA